MKMPQALSDLHGKSMLVGAGLMLFAFGFFGFGWWGAPNFGYVTAGTHATQVKQAFKNGQVAILQVACAAEVERRADAAAMKTAFKSATSEYSFERVFDEAKAQKLIMMPGDSYGDRDLAMACGKLVIAGQKTASR